MRNLLLLLALGAFTPAVAIAGPSTSAATGAANATAIAPLRLSHNNSNVLRFGRFTIGSAGSVTVTPSGASSTSGGVTFLNGRPRGADTFLAIGDPNRAIAIATFPGTVISGASSMSFTTVPMLAVGYLPATGRGTFTVGGTLAIDGDETPGNYTGSYVVTVTYN